MPKLISVVLLLGLCVSIPALAQSGDPCNIDSPMEPVEIEMISWPFAITEFYAAEMEACSEVDNLTINTNCWIPHRCKSKCAWRSPPVGIRPMTSCTAPTVKSPSGARPAGSCRSTT